MSTKHDAARRWIPILILALLAPPITEPALAKKKKKKAAKAAKVTNPEDLLIVDCRLPGQYRQLGRSTPYQTPPRSLRTTAVECRIQGGEYVAYDRASFTTALEVWQAEASGGDPVAQTYVGEIYERGLVGTPDYPSAAIWYERAAEQGHARAQVNLANLYDQGLGVPRDPVAARRWYGKAAGLSDEAILDAEREAEKLREDVERLEKQVEDLEKELAGSRAELEGKEDQLADARRRLEEARAAPAEHGEEEIARLATEVERREEAVATETEDLTARRRALEELSARIAATRARARGVDERPSIEILRPDVLATRGPAIVPVPAGASAMEVRGHVTAPAGIAALHADDRPVTVDGKGLFAARIPFAGERREVELVARDRLGREDRVTLVLQEGGKEASPPAPPPAGPGTAKSAPRSGFTPGAGSYALVIGIADYDHFPDLATAETDAAEVAEVLGEKYGFETRVLANPSRLSLRRAFVELIDELSPDSRLLVYYAGHGKIEDGSRRGYWIPADARLDDSKSWLPNAEISNYLETIPARQVMVISDSCYSGTLTRAGLATARPGDGADRRTRTVLTSGGLQPVLDAGGGRHSLFANALLRVLALFDEPLPGTVLLRKVAARVIGKAEALGVDQVPQYAPIQFAGHEAGDFVLMPRRPRTAAAAASP